MVIHHHISSIYHPYLYHHISSYITMTWGMNYEIFWGSPHWDVWRIFGSSLGSVTIFTCDRLHDEHYQLFKNVHDTQGY